jgi:hypothetical protein
MEVVRVDRSQTRYQRFWSGALKALADAPDQVPEAPGQLSGEQLPLMR